MKNLKKITYLGVIISIGLLITVNMGVAIQNIEQFEDTINSEMRPHFFEKGLVKLDLKPKQVDYNRLSVATDTQITSSDLNYSQPVIKLDYNDNPFLIHAGEYDASEADIFMRHSPDGGLSWPAEEAYDWGYEDMYPIKPDFHFTPDGTRVFGAFSTKDLYPEFHLIDLEDIDDPTTWASYTFSVEDSSSYCEEVAIATSIDTYAAVIANIDFVAQGYDIGETVEIFFGDAAEGTFAGVFLNTDHIVSNICSASGETVYFAFEQLETNGLKTIQVASVELTADTLYSDWQFERAASTRGANVTHPDIDQANGQAYLVYMDDKEGNQDIYCRVRTDFGSWEKHVIVETAEDELYPNVVSYGEGATCTFIKNGDLYITHTVDLGETWSEPEKVNDQTGTVVSEFRSSDIANLGNLVWADNRNTNSDIYFENVGIPSVPIIEITSVSSLIGVTVDVLNSGAAVATDVPWTIDVEGNLVFVGGHTEGTVSVAAGGTETIKSGIVLGLGPVSITVTVGDKSEGASATLLLFLLL